MQLQTEGYGPLRVLALHGWFGTSSSWQDTLRWLDPSRYTFALPDYRGYGSRIEESGAYTLDEMADDAVGLLDELGWEDFAIVGHSMGGKVAQRILVNEPGRVSKIVGVTPVPPGALPLDDETRAVFRRAADSAELRAQIVSASTGGRHSDFVVGSIVEESLRTSTPSAFRSYFDSWLGDDLTDEVKGSMAPVLVIVGEHDNAITHELMQHAFLPFYPNSRIEVLAACGHYPVFETPVALATAIDRFLTQDG